MIQKTTIRRKSVFATGLIALFLSLSCAVQAQTINLFAGTGTAGYSGDGGAATAADINNPAKIAVDGSGNVYFVEGINHTVRKVDASGTITTIAGNTSATYSGDGGQATAAGMLPFGVAVDASGNVYISDPTNHVIRKVNGSTGVITRYIGTRVAAGTAGDGSAATAGTVRLNQPYGITFDNSGNLYIADYGNHNVRVVSAATGNISTFAGTASSSGFSGDGGAATAAQLNAPEDVAADDFGNVFISDNGNNVIRKVNSSGVIATIAGTAGTSGYSGDGGAATAAELSSPVSLTTDAAGNVYFYDASNFRIRRVTPSGYISTVAGTGTSGYSGDGGPATAANLGLAYGLAYDGAQTIYVTDMSSWHIRTLTLCSGAPSAGTVTGASPSVCAGTTGTLGVSGEAGGAWSSSSATIASIDVLTGEYRANSAGTVTLSYIVSNACGADTATSTFLVNPAPDAGTISGTATFCGFSATTFTSTGTPGGTWSSTNTSVATVGVVTGLVGAYATGSATIKYIVTSAGCPSDTASFDITVSPTPSAGTITMHPSGCTGVALTYTSTGDAGGVWSTTDAAIATINAAGVLTPLTSGAIFVKYVVTNSCGADSTQSPINILTTPDAGTIAGTASFCPGVTNTFTTSGTGGGNWTSSNTTVATVSTTGDVTGVAGGTATISYIVTSGSCGNDTATFD
ncbi:MAG: hypothetical protein EBZ77_05405, partial [Chitinophagia bacterium]|nr:hypothetical protein [Chitinophagia bacterium]